MDSRLEDSTSELLNQYLGNTLPEPTLTLCLANIYGINIEDLGSFESIEDSLRKFLDNLSSDAAVVFSNAKILQRKLSAEEMYLGKILGDEISKYADEIAWAMVQTAHINLYRKLGIQIDDNVVNDGMTVLRKTRAMKDFIKSFIAGIIDRNFDLDIPIKDFTFRNPDFNAVIQEYYEDAPMVFAVDSDRIDYAKLVSGRYGFEIEFSYSEGARKYQEAQTEKDIGDWLASRRES